MKLFFDFLPLILFYASYQLFGIWVATGVIIATTVIQVGYLLVRGQKVSNILWVTLVVAVVAGGATLILQDERFIKWKPTLVYAAMALALLFTQYVLKKNPMKALLGSELALPDEAWAKMMWTCAIAFAAMSMLNMFVAFNYSTDVWANFRFFGGIGVSLLLFVVFALQVMKYLPEDAVKPPSEDANKK
jgi:intracellular septation protein